MSKSDMGYWALVGLLLGIMLYCSGCFTSATAYTERYEDGKIISRSKVSVVGTGDKASEIAADGMFADGAADDLGAGVATASSKQTSSGIDGTLSGLGALLGGLSQVAVAMRPVSVPAASDAGASTDLGQSGYSLTESASVALVRGYDGAPGDGLVGIYGRTTCGRCQAYVRAHSDVEIIDIDQPTNRNAMWTALRARGFSGTSVQLPVAITESGYQQMVK